MVTAVMALCQVVLSVMMKFGGSNVVRILTGGDELDEKQKLWREVLLVRTTRSSTWRRSRWWSSAFTRACLRKLAIQENETRSECFAHLCSWSSPCCSSAIRFYGSLSTTGSATSKRASPFHMFSRVPRAIMPEAQQVVERVAVIAVSEAAVLRAALRARVTRCRRLVLLRSRKSFEHVTNMSLSNFASLLL